MAIRPVAMPQMGKETPTVQAMGEGRVPPGKELERQASQRFGTIPRVTKIHDVRSESHDAHEKR